MAISPVNLPWLTEPHDLQGRSSSEVHCGDIVGYPIEGPQRPLLEVHVRRRAKPNNHRWYLGAHSSDVLGKKVLLGFPTSQSRRE